MKSYALPYAFLCPVDHADFCESFSVIFTFFLRLSAFFTRACHTFPGLFPKVYGREKNNSQLIKHLILAIFSWGLLAPSATAQFDTGADFVTRYYWRGQLLASGPAAQPFVCFTHAFDTTGTYSLKVGAWGSYGIASGFDGTEADLYLTFNAGVFSATFTDYFFPSDAPFAGYDANDNYLQYGDKIVNGDTISTGHVYEVSVAFAGTEKFPLSISLSKDIGGGDRSQSFYVDLSYPIGNASIGAGLGDGWYTAGGEFGLVNVSLTYEKLIFDKLPAFGTVAVDPELEKFFIIFGLSF